MKRTIKHISIYTRVSTKKQSFDNKQGLYNQNDICVNYKNTFYPKIKNFTQWKDIGSSYKNGLILSDMYKMISQLKSNTLIIVSKVSRLGRNYKMVEQILKKIIMKKSFVISIAENLVYGISKKKNIQFLKKVFDSEKESDALSTRIKNIYANIKLNGGYYGKPPFGYKIYKNTKNIPMLKENIKHFEFIEYIVNLADKHFNYKEIANIMNRKNKLYQNKLWNSSKIKNILNKFYPEHNLLNNTNLTKLTSDSDIINNSTDIYTNTHVVCNNNNYVKLRSGKIILKF